MAKKSKKKSSSRLALLWQFIKLNLAGNILFWGTMGGFFVLHELLKFPDIPALAIASVFAHFLFFLVDKNWVFVDKTGRRKTKNEILRFILFMGLNYFINLGIVSYLDVYFAVSPYIGQVLAGFFFSVWNYVGLRFWVFQEPKHHAITIQKPRGTKHARRRHSTK